MTGRPTRPGAKGNRSAGSTGYSMLRLSTSQRWLLWIAILALVPLLMLFKDRSRRPYFNWVFPPQAYNGWTNAILIRNGEAQVLVVLAIGRVMQFGLNTGEGVFWENRNLNGQSSSWEAKEWMNFGGDKTWPAPESDWSKFTKRDGWRPPPAFDCLPVEAQVENTDVILVSPVDPFYGIRTRRRIHLDEKDKPIMTIATTYEKVSGAPAKIGVWVITQLKEPVGIYVPVPERTKFTNGYLSMAKELPPSLKVENGLILLTRNPKLAHKIGTEAGSLLWVGEKIMCRIDSPRVADAEYPDRGCSAEVYTNPDPLEYIELETLGPLRLMQVGDRISHTNTYTLLRRSEATAEAEARKVFKR
jgi:hypothetical protein